MGRTNKRKRITRVKRNGKRHRTLYKKMFGGEKSVELARKISDLYQASASNHSKTHKELFRRMSNIHSNEEVEGFINSCITDPASTMGIIDYDVERYRESFTSIRNHLFNGRRIEFRGGKYVEIVAPDPSNPFHCPITGTRMTDPVSDRNGVSYDRAALTAWITANHTNPVTGQPMLVTDMIPNRALRDAIATAPA